MANYTKPVPRDTGGAELHNYPPAYPTQTRYATSNGVASSVISLQPTTTCIEVGAFGGQGAFIRWIPTTETASVSPFASVIASGAGVNFDHYIPVNQYRQFVLPKETAGSPNGQVGSVNGLYQRVAYINAGITASSIMLSEF